LGGNVLLNLKKAPWVTHAAVARPP
jgi:hypothetical protein